MWYEQLKIVRKRLSLTQKGFGEKLGVTKDTYHRWEKGHNQPSIEMLLKIAEIGNISLDWLLTGNDRGGGNGGLSKEELSAFLEKSTLKIEDNVADILTK